MPQPYSKYEMTRPTLLY